MPDKNEGADSPATFEGRLNLTDFMFKGSPDSPRRSARLLSATPTISSTSASSPSPSKRNSPNTQSQDITKSPDPSSTPAKKRKRKSAGGYAPPSTYAHLSLLPDRIAENLLVLFIGLNPGVETARSGHAYAHPSNLFWKLLYSSGITPRRCYAEEDARMPELYSLGLTNIVSRPSRNGAELSKAEMDAGVSVLEAKAREFRPEVLCVVGKSIWESIWRVRHGKPVGKAFKYGWQDEEERMGAVQGEWEGSRVFVATSTSGLAASMSPKEKEEVWRRLGSWVERRRAEREAASR
ncbi:uracil DNA glycosylase superfamily protein [Sarocladium implicatum]|nr:uracil DNA glycosylase superfamily protein [Sarocladium implicatum]